MSVLVVIPTYNERGNLPDLVRAIMTLDGYRVLVVDDGSPDGTGEAADELAREFPAASMSSTAPARAASAAPTSTDSGTRCRTAAPT